jgi:peptidoglycan/xylan/chitin deacetylase (PgdA/CDA1 family)
VRTRFLNGAKRWFVIFVSCCLFVFDRIRGLCATALGMRPRGTCVVLKYHSIPAANRADFARQLDMIRLRAVVVRPDSRAELAAARAHVILTFDDGLISFAENALPELEARDLPSVLFVVAGKIGTYPAWTNYTPGAMPTERMLSADQLRALPGPAVIGSHSLTHPELTILDESVASDEIVNSRRELERLLGTPVVLFSFPYGAYSERLVACCKAAGYQRVFTSTPSLAEPDDFVTGRIGVTPNELPIEFRLKLAGSYRWLPYAFRAKRVVYRALGLLRS